MAAEEQHELMKEGSLPTVIVRPCTVTPTRDYSQLFPIFELQKRVENMKNDTQENMFSHILSH